MISLSMSLRGGKADDAIQLPKSIGLLCSARNDANRSLSWVLAFFIAIYSPMAHAAKVQEVKTPGGFTAWLVEEHSQPLVSVNIGFRNSGTAYDAAGKDGRAAITVLMLLEGAGDMDSESFNRALESSAIKLGFSADVDNFYATLTTLSEHKEKAFSYLGIALTKPRFDESSFDRVKRQTLITIKQQQEKPAYRLSRAWQTQIFGSHPYSKDELGSRETIEAMKADDLRLFTTSYLTRSNIIISVAGDITPTELSTLLDKNLAALPAQYKADVTVPDIAIQQPAKQTVIEQDIPQTIIQFGMEGLKRESPEYIPAYVLNYLLGGGSLTSRFNNEIREKRGLTYSANSMLIPLQHAGLFLGKFSTRNEKVAEAISVLGQVLKDIAENLVTAQELADAKKYLTGSFVVGLDSNSAIVSFITMMQLHNLGIDYMDKRNNLISEVSVEQISQIAKKLIKLDKLQIVMIGKPVLAEDYKP